MTNLSKLHDRDVYVDYRDPSTPLDYRKSEQYITAQKPKRSSLFGNNEIPEDLSTVL